MRRRTPGLSHTRLLPRFASIGELVGQSLVFMAKLLAIALLLASLFGCAPYITSYVHLDGPGIMNSGACAGPPVFATYEAQGARVAVTLEPKLASRSTAGFMRVRAPGGVTVSMPETTGYLIPDGRNPIAFQLISVEPPEERFAREVLRRQGILEHRFEFSGVPPIAFAGALKLPPLYLDSIAVSAPLLKFERRPYAGTVPLNC